MGIALAAGHGTKDPHVSRPTPGRNTKNLVALGGLEFLQSHGAFILPSKSTLTHAHAKKGRKGSKGKKPQVAFPWRLLTPSFGRRWSGDGPDDI